MQALCQWRHRNCFSHWSLVKNVKIWFSYYWNAKLCQGRRYLMDSLQYIDEWGREREEKNETPIMITPDTRFLVNIQNSFSLCLHVNFSVISIWFAPLAWALSSVRTSTFYAIEIVIVSNTNTTLSIVRYTKYRAHVFDQGESDDKTVIDCW